MYFIDLFRCQWYHVLSTCRKSIPQHFIHFIGSEVSWDTPWAPAKSRASTTIYCDLAAEWLLLWQDMQTCPMVKMRGTQEMARLETTKTRRTVIHIISLSIQSNYSFSLSIYSFKQCLGRTFYRTGPFFLSQGMLLHIPSWFLGCLVNLAGRIDPQSQLRCVVSRVLEYDRCATPQQFGVSSCVFEVGWRMFGAWKLHFFGFNVLFLEVDRLIKWINVWQLRGSAVFCSLE